jgi:ubiquinone/menaquinone biosynthesis C-methylase UbiE
MASRPEGYIPAAGHDWLLPLYDPLCRYLLGEDALRREILQSAAIGPGCRVLDVGCGTGTQVVLVKQMHPDAEVVGVDGDEKALAIARGKAERAGVEVTFDEGLATALPYADARFDRVISSLMLHHLSKPDKQRALAEILRVLAPGGAFVLVDFGEPLTLFERVSAKLFLRGQHAHENLAGGLPALLRDAGFSRIEELSQRSIRVGRLWTWRARE